MFDTQLFQEASLVVTDKYLLTNLVSMRTRQLISGAEPLVEFEDMAPMDIALKEIVEGKIEARKEELTTDEDIFG